MPAPPSYYTPCSSKPFHHLPLRHSSRTSNGTTVVSRSPGIKRNARLPRHRIHRPALGFIARSRHDEATGIRRHAAKARLRCVPPVGEQHRVPDPLNPTSSTTPPTSSTAPPTPPTTPPTLSTTPPTTSTAPPTSPTTPHQCRQQHRPHRRRPRPLRRQPHLAGRRADCAADCRPDRHADGHAGRQPTAASSTIPTSAMQPAAGISIRR